MIILINEQPLPFDFNHENIDWNKKYPKLVDRYKSLIETYFNGKVMTVKEFLSYEPKKNDTIYTYQPLSTYNKWQDKYSSIYEIDTKQRLNITIFNYVFSTWGLRDVIRKHTIEFISLDNFADFLIMIKR